jgi:4-amino-4-deoxy-L-arabinose transferase-like glycosyltransferase
MDRFSSRRWHYVIIATAYLLLTLPNLGRQTLWDMDEGVNAEAGREMLESGNWVTPYFNYQIRTAKPALLYWLQAISFALFGVDEFAARIPSVICGLMTSIVTYELARRMFSPTTGLISAVALISCIEFALISHAATPDPPLLLFTTSAFLCFWSGSQNGARWWFVPTAFFCGLAMLTKGPIGVMIPVASILGYLLWSKQTSILVDRRLIWGVVAFLAVSLPWYILVTVETKGVWTRSFFLNENMHRFHEPMDSHSGGLYYHAVLLLALFAPWSFVIGPTLWIAVREAFQKPVGTPEAPKENPNPYRLLLLLFAIVITMFSIAATKLPNYVLPLYPAIAILTGRFLDRWRMGTVELPVWLWTIAIVCLALVGVVCGGALFLAGGRYFDFSSINVRAMPRLEQWAPLGLIPVITAFAFAISVRARRRDLALRSMGVGSVSFVACICAFPAVALNDYKAPESLVLECGLPQHDCDVKLASFKWFRESAVFYSKREIQKLKSVEELQRHLSLTVKSYAFVTEKEYDKIADDLKPCRVVARRYDLLIGTDILVITRDPDETLALGGSE